MSIKVIDDTIKAEKLYSHKRSIYRLNPNFAAETTSKSWKLERR